MSRLRFVAWNGENTYFEIYMQYIIHITNANHMCYTRRDILLIHITIEGARFKLHANENFYILQYK